MSDPDRSDSKTPSRPRQEEDRASRSRERDPGVQTRPVDHRRIDDRSYEDRAYDDEVSLRDLYLVLVRGLPAILVVAVLAGAGAFLVSTLRPPSYEAEATVMSRPPSVRFREDPTVVLNGGEDGASTLLALQAPQGIPLEAYRAIARSRDVFVRTQTLLGDAAPELDVLLGATEVEVASGSGGPLLVHHRLTWNDPDAAAAYTNAWVTATVERVRDSLVADLEPTIRITREAVAERREALAAAESDLMALPSDGDSAEARRERARLEREVASARRAYEVVAGLEPTLAYLAELVPSGTRVLESATPPIRPVGTNTALATALAAVLGAMVATLGVFLREAVRDPDARTDPRTRAASRVGSRTGT